MEKTESTAVSRTPQTRRRTGIGWGIGLIISYFLVSSAVAHIGNPYRFLNTIRSYDLLPWHAAEVAAAVLPFLHLTLSLSFVTSYAQRTAFGIGAGLFLVYAAAQTATLFQGLNVDCGCFSGFGGSADGETIGVQSIGLAVACLSGCVAGLVVTPTAGTDSVAVIAEAAEQNS